MTTSRVYELRTYHAHEGKLEALLARFRDHTTALFHRHGLEVIGYWVPVEGDQPSTDTLVYLLAFESREQAKAAWAAFIADPDWKAARADSERDGPLVAGLESVYMTPTDFSPAS